MNFNTARKNMLLNQVRTWDFISPKTLEIMQQIQREEFVPVEHRKLAFSDLEVPLAHDEHMMKPILEGRILQKLNLNGREKVLEIGTGSAYMTALLASSCEHVTSLDIHQDFIENAKETLQEFKLNNTECINQDIFDYHSTYKFDVIVATGSFARAPEFLLRNLKKDGKIFAIIGESPIMSGCLITQDENGKMQLESLFETFVKPLHNTAIKQAFEL